MKQQDLFTETAEVTPSHSRPTQRPSAKLISTGTTLTEALQLCGFTHRKPTKPRPNPMMREILRGEEVVFVGSYLQVWRWLEREGFIEKKSRTQFATRQWPGDR